MPVDPRLNPDFDEDRAITEAITGQPYGSGGGPRPEDEIRVVLPMDAWDELEYLAADDTDEPTDLATVLSLARDGADVMCEGEQEGDEWAFYVAGFTLEELLPLAQEAVPLRWKVDRVPVHPDAIAVTQIAITRRRC